MGGKYSETRRKHTIVQQGDTHAVQNLHYNYSSHNVLFACLWFSSSNPSRYSCWVLIFIFFIYFFFRGLQVIIPYCYTKVERHRKEGKPMEAEKRRGN